MKTIKAIILLVLLAAVSPLLLQAQTTESFTFTTNRLVPQGNFSGLSDVRNVNSAVGKISALQVRLKITGEYNGDLYAYLRNTNGFVVLLNRVGKTAGNPYGYGDSGFNVTFQAGATNGDIHLYQNITTPADGSPLTGIWDVDGRTNDPRERYRPFGPHHLADEFQRLQRRGPMDAVSRRRRIRRDQRADRNGG